MKWRFCFSFTTTLYSYVHTWFFSIGISVGSVISIFNSLLRSIIPAICLHFKWSESHSRVCEAHFCFRCFHSFFFLIIHGAQTARYAYLIFSLLLIYSCGAHTRALSVLACESAFLSPNTDGVDVSSEFLHMCSLPLASWQSSLLSDLVCNISAYVIKRERDLHSHICEFRCVTKPDMNKIECFLFFDIFSRVQFWCFLANNQ